MRARDSAVQAAKGQIPAPGEQSRPWSGCVASSRSGIGRAWPPDSAFLSLLSRESADALHGTSAHLLGFNDLRGGPAGALWAAIHLEQNLSVLERPSQGLP